MFFHLKFVAKIALAAGAIAVICLVVSLSFLATPQGDSYQNIVRTNSITREEMGPLMLLAGLVLVTMVGVLTWLIALYSSFRIAGPLYRFSQNFKTAVASNLKGLIDLRAGDSLRRQEAAIKQAVAASSEHYAAIANAVQSAERAIQNGDAAGYATACQQLRTLDGKVRI